MRTNSRRKFIKHVALLGASSPFIKAENLFETDSEGYKYESAFMQIRLREDYPEFTSLCIDSLGKSNFFQNPLFEQAEKNISYKSKPSHQSVAYYNQGNTINEPPDWEISFAEKKITLASNYNKNTHPAYQQPDPFEIMINQHINHATVLGYMNKPNQVKLPCLIHFPDRGTFRVSSKNENAHLFFDARRFEQPRRAEELHFVKIQFPPAGPDHKTVQYYLDIVAIHPQIPGIESSLYDGFRKNFINIFQINPRLRVLANNSSSDTVACTLHMYAQVARHTPPLAENLTAMDLVKMTVNRYLNGMKGYTLVGYPGNYEGADTLAFHSAYNTLDALPSMLIAACICFEHTKDIQWAKDYYDKLLGWAYEIAKADKENTGLIKHPESGNTGSWKGTAYQRPANWWDTIGFGHEDAYSNALAYCAFTKFSDLSKKLKQDKQSIQFAQKAAKLKSVYYSTFYNSPTQLLAGWRSADGQLHDYNFTFIQGAAITYGLVEGVKADALMTVLLRRMKETGFQNFKFGLPGNLIPIGRGDYTHLEKRWGGPALEDGSDAFEIYENGGATLCHSYLTIRALQKMNRKADADTILNPILQSIADGDFQGQCANGMSKDWKTWDGQCWGYEGFLVDGYQVLLACIPVLDFHSG